MKKIKANIPEGEKELSKAQGCGVALTGLFSAGVLIYVIYILCTL